MLIFFVTSLLGLIRDYTKYKNICYFKFIRSPLITCLIYNILNILKINNSILLSIIFERWFFLVYKSLLSFYNNDYIKKKYKYKYKYNLNYKN